MKSVFGMKRFFRYELVGVGTFLLDLGMLYVAVSVLGLPYLFVIPSSFLIAVSVNYAISRPFAFGDTTRSWCAGYRYFVAVAVCGAALTTFLVSLLVDYAGLYYLTARIIAAGVVGILNYCVNVSFTFNLAGRNRA